MPPDPLGGLGVGAGVGVSSLVVFLVTSVVEGVAAALTSLFWGKGVVEGEFQLAVSHEGTKS